MGYFNIYNRTAGMINKTSFMGKRRKAFKRSYPRANTVASKLQQIPYLANSVRLIKGMINAEKKYADKTISESIVNTGEIFLVNETAQGDDVANRDGNSILHKYIDAQYSVTLNSSATQTTTRFILFVDTANQGSAPAVTDLISASVDGLKNVDNTRRFVILRDWKINLSDSGSKVYSGKLFRKTNFHCRYSGSGATTVLQNAIYLLIISTEDTNQPTIGMNIRNAFYDN